MMAPAATPSDAFLHLIVVRGGVLSRVGMIRLFLSLSDGSHVKNPAVDYYRVHVSVEDSNLHHCIRLFAGSAVRVSSCATRERQPLHIWRGSRAVWRGRHSNTASTVQVRVLNKLNVLNHS